jgi:hypothetical protein
MLAQEACMAVTELDFTELRIIEDVGECFDVFGLRLPIPLCRTHAQFVLSMGFSIGESK